MQFNKSALAMRHPIKLRIKKRNFGKEGTNQIFIQYYHAPEKKITLGTGARIPKMHCIKK